MRSPTYGDGRGGVRVSWPSSLLGSYVAAQATATETAAVVDPVDI